MSTVHRLPRHTNIGLLAYIRLYIILLHHMLRDTENLEYRRDVAGYTWSLVCHLVPSVCNSSEFDGSSITLKHRLVRPVKIGHKCNKVGYNVNMQDILLKKLNMESE